MSEKTTHKPRRHHTAEFKVRVALEAIRKRQTINEIAAQSGVHPTKSTRGVARCLRHCPGPLGRVKDKTAGGANRLEAWLYEEIGRLKIKLEWLKKVWRFGVSFASRQLGSNCVLITQLVENTENRHRR